MMQSKLYYFAYIYNFVVTLLNSIEEIFKKLIDYNVFGAGEGIRTLDFNLGNDFIEGSSTTLTLK